MKEYIKGHRRLQADVAGRRPNYIGHRYVTRIMSDAYGRGTVRSNQESTNLRVYARDHDVTAAESFHAASTVVMPGKDLTSWREAIFAQSSFVKVLQAATVDRRNPAKSTAIHKNIVFSTGTAQAMRASGCSRRTSLWSIGDWRSRP